MAETLIRATINCLPLTPIRPCLMLIIFQPTDDTMKSRLGILWFIPAPGGGSVLVEHSLPADEIPLVGGFRTLELGHVDLWPKIVREHPSLCGIPYEAFPRGRANWREEDGAWLLLLDRKLHRPAFIDRVVDAWVLPRKGLKVMADPHYRSSLGVGLPRRET